MYVDRPRLKQEAKDILRTAQVSPLAITALYLAICAVLDTVECAVSGGAVNVFLDRSPLPTFIYIFVLLVELVLGAGLTIYCLGIRRGVYMGFSTLFDGFSFVGKIILLLLTEFCFIFLWAMLFFIPGVVAMYRYSFALYNLCEDPSLTPMEALAMSKAQTQGYKMELFKLDLSFIGWTILINLPYELVNALILDGMDMPLSLPALTLLCAVLSGLVAVWVRPYKLTTSLGYFEQAKSTSGAGFNTFPPLDEGSSF